MTDERREFLLWLALVDRIIDLNRQMRETKAYSKYMDIYRRYQWVQKLIHERSGGMEDD